MYLEESDVGVFNRLVNNDIKTILLDDMKIYKGIITENYVANQSKANGIDLLYWKGHRDAQIDFLLTTSEDGIIPVEVKADNHTQLKSLKTYFDLYKPEYMIRLSTKDFGYNEETKIKSIPLYAVFLINMTKQYLSYFLLFLLFKKRKISPNTYFH